MVLGKLIQLLLNNPRVIQQLADSWPIRRAAKMAAYFYLRGKDKIEQSVKESVKDGKIDPSKSRFTQNFKEEIKKQIRYEQQKQTKNNGKHVNKKG